MRFDEREERERYMDNLEQQMEDQRAQIQRTLDRTMENSDQRTALEKLWGSLPNFPSRTTAQGAGERETFMEPVQSETLSSRGESVREASEPRFGWRRIFGR
jgi:hypothetical protein